MSALTRKPYHGIWRCYRILTADGFCVGTIDMRGSFKNQIDRPMATFDISPKEERNIRTKSEGERWINKKWAARVAKWHAELSSL